MLAQSSAISETGAARMSLRELAEIALKPDSLPDVAFGGGFRYDPLEELVKP